MWITIWYFYSVRPIRFEFVQNTNANRNSISSYKFLQFSIELDHYTLNRISFRRNDLSLRTDKKQNRPTRVTAYWSRKVFWRFLYIFLFFCNSLWNVTTTDVHYDDVAVSRRVGIKRARCKCIFYFSFFTDDFIQVNFSEKNTINK